MNQPVFHEHEQDSLIPPGYGIASQAALWYNRGVKSLCCGNVRALPQRVTNLSLKRRLATVDIVSSKPPHGKPHYVYTLAYPDGRVFYVGKGTRDRISVHERQAREGKKSPKCSIIRKIWTNGGEIVKAKLAYFETHKEACMYEIALIFFMDGLTNLTRGGDGSWGVVPSEESRQKMREAQRRPRHPYSEEHRHKLSESHKGNLHSEETRTKMREAHKGQVPPSAKGRVVSEETRRKMSEANKGQQLTDEQYRKMCESLKANQGNSERLRKMNEARRGQTLSEEHRRKMSEAHRRKT